jgi:hypothetical protein
MNTSHSNKDAQEQATPMANLWSTIRRHSHAEFLSTNTRGESTLDIGEDKKSHANGLGLTLPNKPDSLDLLPHFCALPATKGNIRITEHHRASKSTEDGIRSNAYSTVHFIDATLSTKSWSCCCAPGSSGSFSSSHTCTVPMGMALRTSGRLILYSYRSNRASCRNVGFCGHLRCHFCSAVVPQRTVIFANDV